jgi:hypothetical protein
MPKKEELLGGNKKGVYAAIRIENIIHEQALA